MKRAAMGLILIGMVLIGCRTASEPSARKSSKSSNGRIAVEWFKMPPVEKITTTDTLIPILQIGDAYYTTCLGMEIPLQESPNGLQWGLTPSPLAGTSIGYFGPTYPCSIHIVDRTRASFDSSHSPDAIPPVFMTKVDKPVKLLKAKSGRPRKLNDFLGLYYPVWYPWIRMEIRKQAGHYWTVEQDLVSSKPPLEWRSTGRPVLITPFTDGLGFFGFPGGPLSLKYNEDLKRYELVRSDNGIKIPLAKVSPGKDAAIPPLPIGVPTWR
ncbi:MAG: hypothetical protein ACM3VT_15835 [Solirubrobacterales bacterium]